MRRTEIIFDKVLKVCAFIAGFLLIFMMLSICADLFFRRMGRPLMWVIEITEYSLLYIAFLGAAWLLEREGHVRMDIIVEVLSSKKQALLGIVTSIIGSAMSLYLVAYGAMVVWEYYKRGVVECTPLLTPTYMKLIVIPLGSIPLFIQFLRRTDRYLVLWKTASGRKIED